MARTVTAPLRTAEDDPKRGRGEQHQLQAAFLGVDGGHAGVSKSARQRSPRPGPSGGWPCPPDAARRGKLCQLLQKGGFCRPATHRYKRRVGSIGDYGKVEQGEIACVVASVISSSLNCLLLLDEKGDILEYQSRRRGGLRLYRAPRWSGGRSASLIVPNPSREEDEDALVEYIAGGDATRGLQGRSSTSG